MAETITQTARQDLPTWAQPVGFGGLESLFRTVFNAPASGEWYIPRPGAGKGDNPYMLDTSGGFKSYADSGGPFQPFLTGFTPLERAGQNMAINQVKGGQPIREASDQWLLDTLGGAGNTLAKQQQAYTMGGPIAGASRVSLMDALMGRPQEYAQQQYLDQMYGANANAASQSLADLLGQSDVASDASIWSFAGPLAGAARGASADTIQGTYLGGPLNDASQARQYETIQGGFLSPESNPYLTANLDTGLKAISDAYRYGTAPSTAAQFARSGSFGGSAHQQTQQMQQFDLGRNLSDYTNAFLGDNFARERANQLAAIQAERDNYARERANQLAATGQERGYSQSALEAERGRQYGGMENALQRSLGVAMDERGGWRSLLDNTLTRGLQGAEGELGRAVQAQSLIPDLMASRYQDADVLRALGSEYRNFIDAQNQINYQNEQQAFQWPFRLFDILGSGLASMTGGGGVTTQTSTNPNALSPAAQGVGLGSLGLSALSNLGSWLWPGAGGAGTAAAGTP